jgi:helix-turn-helix protein
MAPHPVRRLGTLVEPLAAAVYFAPEAHAAYAELGDCGDFWAPYYASRGACLGETPGLVVAAAFGVFNPAHIAEQLESAWKVARPSQWWTARVRGATAQLERLLGEEPEGASRATELLRLIADNSPISGHPFFAGLISQEWPATLVGDLWHAADLVREHRGDTHTAAYNALGFSAVDMMILTELWWGLPHGLYLASRHWDDATVDATVESLRGRGLIDGDPLTLTDEGIAARVEVEDGTDLGEAGVLDALTEAECEELFGILRPMAATIVAGGGYPSDPNDRTLPGVDD